MITARRGNRAQYWWRRVSRATVSLVAIAVLLALAGLPVYVFPLEDRFEDPDVVFVLGPPTPNRILLESKLRSEYPNAWSLISVSPAGDFAEEDLNGHCDDSRVVCESPDPFTTKGEALMLQRFSATTPEDEVVVITFTPHVARTRYIFAKCYSGKVVVVGVQEEMSLIEWARQYVYQSVAFVKAWLTPCASG